MNAARQGAFLALALALITPLACDGPHAPPRPERGQASPPARSGTQGPRPIDARAQAHEPRPEPAMHLPRVGSLEGQAVSAVPLVPSARVPRDHLVTLPAGSRLALHYPGGASLTITGPAKLAVAPWGEEALLLESGTLRADVERGALHPGSGFWLATPFVRLELVQGARFVVRAFAEAALVSVVSGQLSVQTLNSEGKTAQVLGAGQSALFRRDGSSEEMAKGPATLEDAERWALEQSPPPGGALATSTAFERVEAACRRVGEDRGRELALKAQHRNLRAQRDPGIMDAQRALAEQGAQTFRDVRLLEVQLALLEAASLGVSPGEPAGALIERARALLH